MSFYEVKEAKNGKYAAYEASDREFLTTHNGSVISSDDDNFIRFIAEYVNEDGHQLEGFSPYGIESAYIDFDFENDPDSKIEAILDCLEKDWAFTDRYADLHKVLRSELGWVNDKNFYVRKFLELSGR
jgi:hypothetical protein